MVKKKKTFSAVYCDWFFLCFVSVRQVNQLSCKIQFQQQPVSSVGWKERYFGLFKNVGVLPCWVASPPRWRSGRCTTRSHPPTRPSTRRRWNLERGGKHFIYRSWQVWLREAGRGGEWDKGSLNILKRQERERRAGVTHTHRNLPRSLTSLRQSSCHFILGRVDVAGRPSALSPQSRQSLHQHLRRGERQRSSSAFFVVAAEVTPC